MKKALFAMMVLGFSFGLAACGGSSGGSDNTKIIIDDSDDDDDLDDDDPVATLWGLWKVDDDAEPCEETIQFKKNGTFIGTSHEEIITGTYSINFPDNYTDLRQKLDMWIQSDNGGEDCYGDSEDNSDEINTWYVEYTIDTLRAYDSFVASLPTHVLEKQD